VPGLLTGAAFALAGGEIATVLNATDLFTLAVAEVHGVQVKDVERRRRLVLAVLIGDSAAGIIERVAGRTGRYWAQGLVSAMPAVEARIISEGPSTGQHASPKEEPRRGLHLVQRRGQPQPIDWFAPTDVRRL
jgi:hypothetical protein